MLREAAMLQEAALLRRKQLSVLTRFDVETGDKKPMGTLDGELLNAICCDEEGSLYYYSTTGCIIRWDVEKDVKEELTRPLQKERINIYGTAGLIWNTQGELLLCDLGRDIASYYVLTKEKPVSEKEIRLACLQNPYNTDYMQRMTALFSGEQEVPITMEGLYESDYTDYRNRIFAELVAGKGPEIFFVSYEDMEILQDKGLLCDLSEMISEDALSNAWSQYAICMTDFKVFLKLCRHMVIPAILSDFPARTEAAVSLRIALLLNYEKQYEVDGSSVSLDVIRDSIVTIHYLKEVSARRTRRISYKTGYNFIWTRQCNS